MPNKRNNYTRPLSAWAKLWNVSALPNRITITFSSRLRASLGRTRPQSGAIRLNASLATAPRSVVLEILCHEAAHVAAVLLHGSRVKPHGPEWRRLVEAAGYRPTVALKCRYVPAPSPKPRQARALIRYRCPACHADYAVRRKETMLACTFCHREGATIRLRLLETAPS